MLSPNSDLLFQNHEYLGVFNPYYFVNDKGEFIYGNSFQEIVDKYDNDLQINSSAIYSVLSQNYILGDLTILKNIFRSPWMAKPNLTNTGWEFCELPKHAKNKIPTQKIASILFEKLCDEIISYVKGNKRIGILLSGGMDSRIVAGVLNFLIKTKRVEVDKVVSFTWGNNNSRDFIYANQIANHFKWEFKHYTIDENKFWRNILLAGERGCEYSAFHLHAIPDIANDAENEVDIMLAGSYGDSVGRAEFSGKHVSNLPRIEQKIGKHTYLLNNVSSSKNLLLSEIEKYHKLFPRDSQYQTNEIDMQLHYMRRMLNPCMEIINEKVPLYQAFTSPEVFSFMWSLDPYSRNDHNYKELLSFLDPKLSEIPWARTGRKYGETVGVPDDFTKKHHSYEDIVQNKLKDRITQFLNDSNSSVLSVDLLSDLNKLISINKGSNFDYLESLIYSLSVLHFENINFKDRLNITKKTSALHRKLKLYGEYFFYRTIRKYVLK